MSMSQLNPETRSPLPLLLMGCGALVAIGSLMPWASISGLEANGTAGDGKYTLALGVIAAGAIVYRLLSSTPSGHRLPSTLGAGLCLLIAAGIAFSNLNDIDPWGDRIADINGLFNQFGSYSTGASISSGLYLTLVAAVAGCVIALLLVLKSSKQDG